MYYCIGNPLSMNILGQEPDIDSGMMLEFQNDFVQLTGRQTMAYCLTFARERNSAKTIKQMETLSYGTGYSDNDIQTLIKELIKKKVVFDVNSDDEFMDELGGYELLRQGMSTYVDEDLRKHILQPCIRFSYIDVPISDFELGVWRKCNRSKTIKELYNDYFSDLALFDFICAVKSLKAKGSLFII